MAILMFCSFLLRGINRTVPTQDQILVPETLLKKRKANEKTTEERASEAAARKKVCSSIIHFLFSLQEVDKRRAFDDDTNQT